jgi:hypothetical protein
MGRTSIDRARQVSAGFPGKIAPVPVDPAIMRAFSSAVYTAAGELKPSTTSTVDAVIMLAARYFERSAAG